jgi:hypothetical protein
MTTTSTPNGVSGEQHPTLAATEGQLALRAELLKLLGFGPNDLSQRPLTFQTLDGAPWYKEGHQVGFFACVRGTPTIAELLVREGEDEDLVIDFSCYGGKFRRVSLRDFGGMTTQKYLPLVQACGEVFQEINGGSNGH